MDLNMYISIFDKLGKQLIETGNAQYNGIYQHFKIQSQQNNAWFTPQNINYALTQYGNLITKNNIENWLTKYKISKLPKPKNIGLVLAGNIPLVGFHDILCCLILGHSITVKLSKKDVHLYLLIQTLLCNIDNCFENKITFTDNNINNTDAIIATGGDNTSRYFEYYFANRPNIIRKNRHSLAILTDTETPEELEQLGNDMFSYFGLGCRNVSHLIVPAGYKFNNLLSAINNFANIIEHNKYANNYTYQKTILAMNAIEVIDNGFLILREHHDISSPVSVINYSTYTNPTQVTNFYNIFSNKIQCVTSKTKWPFKTYQLGTAQSPGLNDYADNIDTINFLLNI